MSRAYEVARRSAPKDPLVLQTLAERARYLGFPEIAIPALETAAASGLGDIKDYWQ